MAISERHKVRKVSRMDVEIGRAIRAFRLQQGLKMEDLAVKCNVSYQQIQKYEQGLNRVSVVRLTQIADALDVPLSAFLENGKQADPIRGSIIDRQAAEMLSLFNALKPKTRRIIIDICKELSE